MKVGTFAVMCQSLIHAATLERAIQQWLRGYAIIFDDLRCELIVGGAEASLRMTNRISDPSSRIFADELFLISVHGVMCWLSGRRIPFTQASFAFAEPTHSAEYHAMFCSDLKFDAPQTESVSRPDSWSVRSCRTRRASKSFCAKRTAVGVHQVPATGMVGSRAFGGVCVSPAAIIGPRWKRWPISCMSRRQPYGADSKAKAVPTRRSRTVYGATWRSICSAARRSACEAIASGPGVPGGQCLLSRFSALDRNPPGKLSPRGAERRDPPT